MIGAKITEEAAEVVEAAGEAGEAGREHFIREVGDLVYHLLVLMQHRECSLADLEGELARRFGVSGLEEKAARKTARHPKLRFDSSRKSPKSTTLNPDPCIIPMSENLRIGIPSKGRLAEMASRAADRGGAEIPPAGAKPVRARPRYADRDYVPAHRRHSRVVRRRGDRHGHHRRRSHR